jgi:hypothetical protein
MPRATATSHTPSAVRMALTLEDRPDHSSDVYVNINADHNQQKPQNVIDGKLKVQE